MPHRVVPATWQLYSLAFLVSLPVACSSKGGDAGTEEVASSGGAGGEAGSPGSFLRAQGTTIVDGEGRQVFLRGVSFGNEVWANRAVPDDHGEIDFGRLAPMGANSTRFLLNYFTFQTHPTPAISKQPACNSHTPN